MRIVQKNSRSVHFCFLKEGEVFLDREGNPYMKVRPYDDSFNAVRLSDGVLGCFVHDVVVMSCPDAFLTLEEEK